MKKIALLPAILLLIILFGQKINSSHASEAVDATSITDADKNLIRADNKFGLKLFREITSDEPDKNVFVSPLSISMALAMTLNGAGGSTFDAMQQTMELRGFPLDEINSANRNLLKILTNLDSKITLEMANSIWYRDTFPFLNEFIELNNVFYDAEIRPADFKNPAVPEIINNWVDEKTHGKIKNIVEPPFDPETVMFLINAVYFKGDWTRQFENDRTKEDWFILPDNTKEKCKLMMQENRFPYFETDQFQAIDLPYGNGRFSMMIFLPKVSNGEDINSLSAKLNDENWSIWSSGFSTEKVILYVPKIEIEYEILLNDMLKKLGMAIAFDSIRANFRNMYDTTRSEDTLYIDEVLHKSYIKVNEEGTEAAAVTKVAMKVATASLDPQSRVIVMRIDHPFILAIRERQSKSILFMGKIVNPGMPE